jgi:hypothetical protein
MDLDFLDTSGYVVLPIESPALPLDARPEKGESRPAEKFEITQTLDERQAAQGKLILEVKATAHGLVPELDRLLSLESEGFEIVKTHDQGLSVSKFEPDAEKIAIASERTWLVTLKARDDLLVLPTKFSFARTSDAGAKMTYQRYDDADLAQTEPVVELERSYGKRQTAWLWLIGGGVVLLGLAGVGAWLGLRRKPEKDTGRWKLPEPLTPFTAIALLEQIRKEGGLSREQEAELSQSIRGLEKHYFAATNGEGRPDLRQVTQGWVQRAR